MARFINEIISLWDVVGISKGKGKKNLVGKPEWCVVPMDAMEGVVRVFEKGFKKYGGGQTWLPGIRFSLLFSAICRHLFDWFFKGMDRDRGSGQHPLCHVIANSLMLLTFIDRRQFDDRKKLNRNFKPVVPETRHAKIMGEMVDLAAKQEEKDNDYTKKN